VAANLPCVLAYARVSALDTEERALAHQVGKHRHVIMSLAPVHLVGPHPHAHHHLKHRRLKSAFVYKGSVFGCNGAKRTASSRPGILWYELRIRDGALLQEGFVDDPKSDYLHPSLAVDSRGNIGLGCTRTSETEFPSVYVMMHAATDPANTTRASILAVPGSTYYRYAGIEAINLSHYSTTCIDPSNPDLLWTYQAYGTSTVDKQWCTAWAAFSLPSSSTKPKGSAPDIGR
jgi:hypothetical protein